MGYIFSTLFTQHKFAKGYIFTTTLQKDKLNRGGMAMQGGQPSAHCFFEVVNMAKQGMLFDFCNMAFQNIWLENTNEKPLSTKPVIAQIKIFC